jgi:hypothetical protein
VGVKAAEHQVTYFWGLLLVNVFGFYVYVMVVAAC